jgi:acetyl esterase
MALDPQVADILRRVERAQHPDFSELGVAEARLAYRRAAKVLDIPARAVARVDDFSIRGSERPIAVRVYVPRQSTELFPVLVYYHGGGFTIGVACSRWTRIVSWSPSTTAGLQKVRFLPPSRML